MFKADIKNLNKVLKDLEKFGDAIDKDVDIITESNAKEIEAMAKSKAPVDTGFLRNLIATQGKDSNYKVVANAPYSAYMEFGTGGEVEVPEEMKDIAIQFKGKGVKRINLRPRPFLYPSFVIGRRQYIKDLTDLLNRLTKKI
jgi:HK97 gp10 family phage protein